MSAPLMIVANIVAQESHREAVEKALRDAVIDVRSEPGCERYELNRDLSNPNTFVMIERWRDVAAAEAHNKSSAFLTLAKALEGKASLYATKLAHIA